MKYMQILDTLAGALAERVAPPRWSRSPKRHDLAVSSNARIGAGRTMDHLEPGFFHQARQEIDGPVVGWSHGVGERFKCRSSKESEQQPASRPDAASELRERCLHADRVCVDQRVPSEHPAERPRIHSERIRLTDAEGRIGIHRASLLHELGHRVDPCNLNAPAAEPVGPLARAAPHVEQRPSVRERPFPDEIEIDIGDVLDAPDRFGVFADSGAVACPHAFDRHGLIIFGRGAEIRGSRAGSLGER